MAGLSTGAALFLLIILTLVFVLLVINCIYYWKIYKGPDNATLKVGSTSPLSIFIFNFIMALLVLAALIYGWIQYAKGPASITASAARAASAFGSYLNQPFYGASDASAASTLPRPYGSVSL